MEPGTQKMHILTRTKDI